MESEMKLAMEQAKLRRARVLQLKEGDSSDRDAIEGRCIPVCHGFCRVGASLGLPGRAARRWTRQLITKHLRFAGMLG